MHQQEKQQQKQIIKLLDSQEDHKLYKNFIHSIKTQVTRENYLKFLQYYLKFLGVKTLRELIENKPQKIIESDIIAYMIHLRNQKKIILRLSKNVSRCYKKILLCKFRLSIQVGFDRYVSGK